MWIILLLLLLLGKQKKCSGCSNMIDESDPYSTCIACRTRSEKNRLKNKEKQVLCNAKVQVGKNTKKCTFKVHKECGNRYCKKHKSRWLVEQNRDDEKNIQRCNSRYQCSADTPGVKAILPRGYTQRSCVSCLAHAADGERDRRHGTMAKNDNLIKKTIQNKIMCKMSSRK